MAALPPGKRATRNFKKDAIAGYLSRTWTLQAGVNPAGSRRIFSL